MTWAGQQHTGDGSDKLSESAFVCRVDVFVRFLDYERIAVPFFADFVESFVDGLVDKITLSVNSDTHRTVTQEVRQTYFTLVFCENASLGQPDNVCLASLDVGSVHALVVAERLVEGLHERVNTAGEPSAPDR